MGSFSGAIWGSLDLGMPLRSCLRDAAHVSLPLSSILRSPGSWGSPASTRCSEAPVLTSQCLALENAPYLVMSAQETRLVRSGILLTFLGSSPMASPAWQRPGAPGGDNAFCTSAVCHWACDLGWEPLALLANFQVKLGASFVTSTVGSHCWWWPVPESPRSPH